MSEDHDGYEAYYAERLWQLLPGIYRTLDSDDETGKGPLREIVERVGAQMGVLRRSIDRTWEDQSIESCDDWLIPYIGEILATNIVAGLSARAQRLDVANTIYYRRRKGTLAILEEIAADITGWNARAVEFFTRLARTRHLFDPEIGVDPDSAFIAGLRGARSLTPRGGFADLRHAAAATASVSAFDEYFHTADFRRGAAASGWHNITKLGVFVWRLKSFGCGPSTPVEHAQCPGHFTFDPTGREIPLFAEDVRDKSQYGDAWVTPDEWMLPTPITRPLFTQDSARLYPDSLAVLQVSGPLVDVLPLTTMDIQPERGCLRLTAALPPGAVPQVRYQYGFSSMIGAGPFDRRALGETPPAQPTPQRPPVKVKGGEKALADALASLLSPKNGTVSISDSLTYTGPADLTEIGELLVRGEQNERPVIRGEGAAWVLTGAGPATRITLEGLLLSGHDIVLRGQFDKVELFCATLDPGEGANATGATPRSIDDRLLVPTTLWIEGRVAKLRVRRSITGPIRTRGAGRVAEIEVLDSIVQGVRTVYLGAFAADELADPKDLATGWKNGEDPLTTFLREGFAAPLQAALAAYDPATAPDAALIALLVDGLNAALAISPLYDAAWFAHLPLPPELVAAALAGPTENALRTINRLLLEAAYPVALAGAFATAELSDPRHLATRWKNGEDPLTTFLRSGFGAPLQAALGAYNPASPPDDALIALLVGGLNAALATNPLYAPSRFAHLPLPPELVAAALAGPTGNALRTINRLLLETAYPVALAPASIASVEAQVSLSRTTCLGAVYAHRISASETILAGFARATDAQNGCVRFSAYEDGSRLHQPYESVAVRPPGALFVSRRYGDPGYAQLGRLADREIVAGAPGASIRAGAQNGSEMGAFAGELNAIKERGLLLKLKEYMPIGITPVLIDAT